MSIAENRTLILRRSADLWNFHKSADLAQSHACPTGRTVTTFDILLFLKEEDSYRVQTATV
jgi:hypothetical protein